MERVLDILQNLHPEINFVEETGLVERRILDSFDIVTLVSELMDEFEIEIEAEDMVPVNFDSLEAIWNLVCVKQKEG